nr:RNA-directed DNA polymerase, eukaryota [Tanacetum cinerariifolium]
FDFITHCKKRVGDGHSTRFCYDNWISDQHLRDRAMRDGAELQQWSDLNSLSGSVSLSSSKDRWICDLTGDGDFQVKEICRWWDLDWYDLAPFSDWYAWFSAIRFLSSLKLLLEGVFYVAWWHLWVFRNRSIFDAAPPRRSVIFDDIVSRSFNWCSSRSGSESRPLILNKENYVPWSSRLLRPNRKLIYNSIINGPYVRRMIPEVGDANWEIAQPGMNMGQDKHMQMVGGNGGNQFRQYARQNIGNQNGYNAVHNVGNQVVQNAIQNPGVQNVENQNGLIVVSGIANQNPNGNGNVVAARAEGNAIRNNGNQIMCYNCRGLGHLARNCIVRLWRRDVAYLQTQLLIAQKEEA